MTVLVASHIPVNQFVADYGNHGDWQPNPPVRDQSLTHTRLAADLNQEPGRGDEQDEEPNDSQNRRGGHSSRALPDSNPFRQSFRQTVLVVGTLQYRRRVELPEHGRDDAVP